MLHAAPPEWFAVKQKHHLYSTVQKKVKTTTLDKKEKKFRDLTNLKVTHNSYSKH